MRLGDASGNVYGLRMTIMIKWCWGLGVSKLWKKCIKIPLALVINLINTLSWGPFFPGGSNSRTLPEKCVSRWSQKGESALLLYDTLNIRMVLECLRLWLCVMRPYSQLLSTPALFNFRIPFWFKTLSKVAPLVKITGLLDQATGGLQLQLPLRSDQNHCWLMII